MPICNNLICFYLQSNCMFKQVCCAVAFRDAAFDINCHGFFDNNTIINKVSLEFLTF